MIVVVVDNCVRTNPRKYFMSGPACGKRNKLKIDKKSMVFMLKELVREHKRHEKGNKMSL